jgi:hypothetical protein
MFLSSEIMLCAVFANLSAVAHPSDHISKPLALAHARGKVHCIELYHFWAWMGSSSCNALEAKTQEAEVEKQRADHVMGVNSRTSTG